MKWFGGDWGAPVCALTEKVSVPIGGVCERCEKVIAAGDCGFVLGDNRVVIYHRSCLLKEVLGEEA